MIFLQFTLSVKKQNIHFVTHASTKNVLRHLRIVNQKVRKELRCCCTICNVHDGEWRNAKYSPRLRRWELGKTLPDGVNILAYHQRMWKPQVIEINAIQYNNYIISGYLLAALMKDNGFVNEEIQKKYPVSDYEYQILMELYETAFFALEHIVCSFVRFH